MSPYFRWVWVLFRREGPRHPSYHHRHREAARLVSVGQDACVGQVDEPDQGRACGLLGVQAVPAFDLGLSAALFSWGVTSCLWPLVPVV